MSAARDLPPLPRVYPGMLTYDEWADYGDPACWSWGPPPDLTRWEEYRHTFPELARPTIRKEMCLEGLMENWHEDRCALCGRDGRGRLVTDHNHATGWVRGLLCRRCNTKEGMTRGGVWEKYRQHNPAVICDVWVVYCNPRTGEEWKPQPAARPMDPWVDSALKGIGF